MVIKKALVLCLLAAMCAGMSFASELTAKEGINYFNEGVKAQKSGDLQTAMTAYQKAMYVGLDVATYRKFIYNNVGVIYAETGNTAQAEEMFVESLRIDPAYKQANFNLGILYIKMGQCSKSLEFLTRAYGMTGAYSIEEEKSPQPK